MENNENQEQQDNCPICLEDLEDPESNMEIITISCRCRTDRRFHRECLGRWVQINPTCPICGVNLLEYQENQNFLREYNVYPRYEIFEMADNPRTQYLSRLVITSLAVFSLFLFLKMLFEISANSIENNQSTDDYITDDYNF